MQITYQPMGFSVVRPLGIAHTIRHRKMLDGMLMLDIKAAVPEFDHQPLTATGGLRRPRARCGPRARIIALNDTVAPWCRARNDRPVSETCNQLRP